MSQIFVDYQQLHNRVFQHKTLLCSAAWEKIMLDTGFRIVQSKKILSPRLTRWFDLLSVCAWPYRLGILLGYPLVWRPAWLNKLAKKLLGPLLAEDGPEGSNLLLVVSKPVQQVTSLSEGNGRRTPSRIENGITSY